VKSKKRVVHGGIDLTIRKLYRSKINVKLMTAASKAVKLTSLFNMTTMKSVAANAA